MNKLLFYLAHPYSAPTKDGEEKNFLDVNRCASELLKVDIVVYSPITHMHPIHIVEHRDWQVWMDLDKILMDKCDGIILCDGWEKSRGCIEEEKEFKKQGKPVFYYDDVISDPTIITSIPVSNIALSKEDTNYKRKYEMSERDYQKSQNGVWKFGGILSSVRSIVRKVKQMRVDNEKSSYHAEWDKLDGLLKEYEFEFLEYMNMKQGDFFPKKTLDWLIERAKNIGHPYYGFYTPEEMLKKLEQIKTFNDVGKKNRWFGYYQAYGQIEFWWHLGEIIEMVKEEREEWLNGR